MSKEQTQPEIAAAGKIPEFRLPDKEYTFYKEVDGKLVTDPEQAQEYFTWAQETLAQAENCHRIVELPTGHRLHIWKLNEPKEPDSPIIPNQHLILSPHPDDAAIALGATIYKAAQVGDKVAVVDFFPGNAGRYNRGFDGEILPTVRIAEELVSLQGLGVEELIIPEFPDKQERYGNPVFPNNLGLHEWEEDPQDPDVHMCILATFRHKVPRFFYSPPRDFDIDSHFDHSVIGHAGEKAARFGPANQHYRNEYGTWNGGSIVWVKYLNWAGKENLNINEGTGYIEEDDAYKAKMIAILAHQSQGAPEYVRGALGRDAHRGGFAAANPYPLIKDLMIEPVEVIVAPSPVDDPFWMRYRNK